MDWRNLIIFLVKGVLKALADAYDPAGRKDPPKKDAPRPKEPPRAEPRAPQAAPQSAQAAGWGAPTEPQAVTVLRVETDEGSVISPVSFIGDEHFAPERVQRARRPGESRRVRRKAQAEATPRVSRFDAFAAEVRARSNAMIAREEETRGANDAAVAAHRRRRRAGEPRAIAQLTPATLLLLTVGEPLTGAARAA